MRKDGLDSLLAPVLAWPETDQEKLVRAMREIEARTCHFRIGKRPQDEHFLRRDKLMPSPMRQLRHTLSVIQSASSFDYSKAGHQPHEGRSHSPSAGQVIELVN